PQGGIISPILANIYLNELDQFIRELTHSFTKGERRTPNPEYKRINDRLERRIKNLRNQELSEEKQAQLRTEIKELREERMRTSFTIPDDQNYKRMFYTRYA
ncbi:reverse transcriptase domain-containing protein, partial [Escherichia coli]